MAHRVRVRLRDTKTGEEGVHEYDAENADGAEFYWTDGNMACDCNRMQCLHEALGRPDPAVGCGSSRVVIVDASIDGVRQEWK